MPSTLCVWPTFMHSVHSSRHRLTGGGSSTTTTQQQRPEKILPTHCIAAHAWPEPEPEPVSVPRWPLLSSVAYWLAAPANICTFYDMTWLLIPRTSGKACFPHLQFFLQPAVSWTPADLATRAWRRLQADALFASFPGRIQLSTHRSQPRASMAHSMAQRILSPT
jgi:hypothetical protein